MCAYVFIYSDTSVVRTPLGSLQAVLYIETSVIRTPLGSLQAVLYIETSVMRTPLGPQLTSAYGGVHILEDSNVHMLMWGF